MKYFVCLLEKYWVGSKVLVLFSFKIICNLCHCWIYCVVCLWLTTLIHKAYASLHCSPIICQMSKEGNIKNKKCQVSVAIPCLPALDQRRILMFWRTHWASPNEFPSLWAVRFRATDRGPEAGISGKHMAGRLLEVWKPAECLPKWTGSGDSS